jgi:hypothetical protein
VDLVGTWPCPRACQPGSRWSRATYQPWSNFTPEAGVVAKFAVLRARLGPEGYRAEGFSIWDSEAVTFAAYDDLVPEHPAGNGDIRLPLGSNPPWLGRAHATPRPA